MGVKIHTDPHHVFGCRSGTGGPPSLLHVDFIPSTTDVSRVAEGRIFTRLKYHMKTTLGIPPLTIKPGPQRMG